MGLFGWVLKIWWKVTNVDGFIVTHQHGAFNDMAQFSDISGPIVFLQVCDGSWRDIRNNIAGAEVDLANEGANKSRYILFPFP